MDSAEKEREEKRIKFSSVSFLDLVRYFVRLVHLYSSLYSMTILILDFLYSFLDYGIVLDSPMFKYL